MRVALVHDYLNQYGGGERVLETLMEIFPEAPIYTLLYDEQKTGGRFSGRVKGASLLDFQFARDNHRPFIPLMPFAAKFLDLSDAYDLVISDSAGYAKGVTYDSKAKHISYIHTPLRYAWETEDYIGIKYPVSSIRKLVNFFVKPVANYLRNWDYEAGQKPDLLIANSNFIAGKIKKYYGREAKVIYPPVDMSKFCYSHIRANESINYYLAIGRLLHYKRFDLVIDAFAKSGLPLKIVGSGPERKNLESRIYYLKAKNIELIPFVESDNELRKLYSGAKALIFPQVEDFGLVAAEAQACGTPIIAYAAGGALEIVEEGKTGLFFKEQTPEALAEAVRKFETLKFNRRSVAARGKRFSKENFKKEFLEAVRSL